jgi:hypothetical protein
MDGIIGILTRLEIVSVHYRQRISRFILIENRLMTVSLGANLCSIWYDGKIPMYVRKLPFNLLIL